MKRINLFSFLLVAVLLINLFGIMSPVALAEEASYPKWENGVYLIETYEQLRTLAASAVEDANARLVADIDVTDRANDREIVLHPYGDMTLDLNGHLLKRRTTSIDCYLIKVLKEATFTIYDSSKDKLGACVFQADTPTQPVGVILNNGGNVTIQSGSYCLVAKDAGYNCGVISADSGTTVIDGGYFDGTGCGKSGAGVMLRHWAFLYEPPTMVIRGGTFFANDGIFIAPFDQYLKYGCTYPSVFVLDGTFHITGEDEYSGFAYCNNGWGDIYVAGGTFPIHCLNRDSYNFAYGATKKEVGVKNPAGKAIACYTVTPPAVLQDDVSGVNQQALLLLQMIRQWADRYSDITPISEYNPFLTQVVNYVRPVLVNRKHTAPVQLSATYPDPDAIQTIEWFTSKDGETWEHLTEHSGKTTIAVPRPQEATNRYYQFEITRNDGQATVMQDEVLLMFQAAATTTVLDTISFHINPPEDGQKPSEEIYIDATTLGGYYASTFHWVDKTAGGLVNTFIPGHEYELQVILKVEEDFAFATNGSQSALQAFCNYNQATINVVGGTTPDKTVRVTYNFGVCPAVVSTANVELCPPVAGAQRDISPKVGNQNFTVYSVDWYDVTESRFMEKGELFVNGHHYTVQVWLEIDDGFQFQNDGTVPQVKGTLNGKPAPITDAYEQALDQMVVLNYDFGICDSVIDLVHVVDLCVPVAGENPVIYAETLSDDYHVSSVFWTDPNGDDVYGSDVFEEGVTYTASIQLLPKKFDTQYLFTFADNTRAFVNGVPADRVERSGNSLIIYATYTCEKGVSYGDVNADGAVDAKDALLVLQAAVGKVNLSAAQKTAGDVDGNDSLNAVDALLILQKAVGKIEKFPVEQ